MWDSLELELHNGYELPCGVWERNLGIREEQPVPFTTELRASLYSPMITGQLSTDRK